MRGLSRGPCLIAGLLALGSLTPAVVRAQEWHELYADGQQALRNGQAQRAAELFRRAIQRRPQPGVGVPTYGTNFEPRYFPYLRLAEACLRLEAYEEARKALETSARIGVEPAAERAALETRVRLALDQKHPAPEPTPPPTPASTAAVPPAAPTPTPLPTPPRSEPAILPPSAPRAPTSPAPSTAPPRPIAPVPKEPRALDITSDPPAARVFIDDEPLGRTDPETGRLRLTGLRPGRHRVRLSLEGHEDLVREVELAGESLAFHGVLPLRPPPSVPSAAAGATEPGPTLLRWPVVGLFLAAALVLFLWVRTVSPRAPVRERALTPTPRAADSDRGTDEGLPVGFGEYRLIRRLGKGGMASVYEAERRGERFALKRPLPGFLDDPRFLERFLREAELGRALHHPNIIRIFDRGQVGSMPYFAMELVDGETLRAASRPRGPPGPDLRRARHRPGGGGPRLRAQQRGDPPRPEAVEHHARALGRCKGDGLRDRARPASRGGDHHRRLSRHPVLRRSRNRGGRPPSPAATSTLSASCCFEMLTGSLPFRGENAFAVLRSHCLTPPPAPSSMNYALSEDLDRIVLRLLSKEPSGRPTAEELLNLLSDHLRRVGDVG